MPERTRVDPRLEGLAYLFAGLVILWMVGLVLVGLWGLW